MKSKKLIKGGQVHNGKNFVGELDILVEKDRVIDIAPSINIGAGEVFDAQGYVVSPGFIDVHNHGQPQQLDNNEAINCVSQGVTSIIIGNCGDSGVYHSSDGFMKQIHLLEEAQLAVNVGSLIGHNSLRHFALDEVEKFANDREITKMCRLLDAAMKQGALGLSSGLMYSPGIFADQKELELLVRVVSKYDGVYSTHMRDEGDHIYSAVEEALDTAKRGKARLQISHHKVVGQRNQGKTYKTTALIEERRKHQQVNVDIYPYTATSTVLQIVIPRVIVQRAHGDFRQIKYDPADEVLMTKEGLQTLCPRGWQDIEIVSSEVVDFVGKSIQEIAEGSSSYKAVIDILHQDPDTYVVFHDIISEPDLHYVASLPYTMVGSDGFAFSSSAKGVVHPRSYGSFSRILREYVKERSLFPLEDAINRMTLLPAEVFQLQKRGRLIKGGFADIAIFDPLELRDHATYDHPRELSSGMHGLMVNGYWVFRNSEFQGRYPGRLLK